MIMADTSTAGQVAGSGRGAPAPAPVGLPCRNINNSISTHPKTGPRYRFKESKTDGVFTVSKDHAGREFLQHIDRPGVHEILDPADLKKGAEAKRSFILRRHVEAFISHYGRDRVVFFTITDRDNIAPKEYARRWNSLLTNESEWITGFVRVLEPQKNGRPHFHNLTAVNFDTKPDSFNWDAFAAAQEAYRQKDWATFKRNRAAYVASAPPELRELWSWGRRAMEAYGLGRCEILPVRKQGAISEYIGKYLDKGMRYKVDAWKGVRRFETDRRTSQEWKRCGSKFSWFSPGSVMWRARVGQLAFALGIDHTTGDLSLIRRKLGPRWGYRLRGAIISADQKEWVELLYSLGSYFGHINVSIAQ